jgi:hypothetical protein
MVVGIRVIAVDSDPDDDSAGSGWEQVTRYERCSLEKRTTPPGWSACISCTSIWNARSRWYACTVVVIDSPVALDSLSGSLLPVTVISGSEPMRIATDCDAVGAAEALDLVQSRFGVRVREPKMGLARRSGQDRLDIGKTSALVDRQSNRPWSRLDQDLRTGTPDAYVRLGGKLPAPEDGHCWDQHVVDKRQFEAARDKQLPAIGGDDLTFLALQLQPGKSEPNARGVVRPAS